MFFSIQTLHVRVLKSPIQLGAKTYYPGSKEVEVYLAVKKITHSEL